MRLISIFVWLLIPLALLSFLAPALCSSADWHYYVLESESCGGVTSMGLDSQGKPHVIYTDYDANVLTYTHYNGNEWLYETIEGTYFMDYPSMVLDSQDFPHISCHDDYDDDLIYVWYDGTDWVFEMVDDEDEAGVYNSIALDSNGYPHIAYDHQISGGGDLRYAYKDVYGWHIEVVDDECYSQGDNCSLALDSQDNANISYNKYNPTEYAYYLSYAHYDGSQWQIENVQELASYGAKSSIAVDSQDRPHIAFYTIADVNYARWDGTEWLIEEVDETFEGGVSLVLDSQEYPHIAYRDFEYGYLMIKYAVWNGSEWEIEVACDEGDLGCISISMGLDSEGNPHIACDEWDEMGIWYIWYGDPLVDITLEQFSAHAEGSAITVKWSVETTEDDQITGFNLYRRELPGEASSLGDIAHHTIKDDWLKINPSLITGENPYSYTDSSVESGVAYEYKLEAVLADENPETLGTTQATSDQPTSFAILALYPNPASDYLTCLLALPSAGVVELRLYDISGRLVLSQQLEATEPAELEGILDVSGLASGVYTLRASSGEAEVSARAVLVR